VPEQIEMPVHVAAGIHRHEGDLTAEFYLETVKTVFQDATLARNELTFEGAPIDILAVPPSARCQNRSRCPCMWRPAFIDMKAMTCMKPGSAKAQQIETFYDEYFAVLDLTAEFYLETVKTVFQDAVQRSCAAIV
jgi:poly-beta-hydroxyalkanoate depolymerase